MPVWVRVRVDKAKRARRRGENVNPLTRRVEPMNDDVYDDVNDGRVDTSPRPARRQFLRATVGAGLALADASALPLPALAAAPPALPTVSACGESARDIIDTVLTVERLATTFYYMGLTTRSIVGSARVAGSSANPN